LMRWPTPEVVMHIQESNLIHEFYVMFQKLMPAQQY